MASSYIYTLLLVIIGALSNAQCPTAPITLATQNAVDNFAVNYPGCTGMPAGADITITGNNITNLNGLSMLTSVQAMEIRNNPQLVSIAGLQISNAASDFIIRSNPLLPNVNGLQNLATVQGEFTLRSNNKLADISSLSSLTTVNLGLIVRDNPLLVTLNGLQSLTVVGDILELTENDLLSDISALSGVISITGGEEGAILIEANPLLTNLNGLGNANTVITGDLTIQDNNLLSVCAVSSICDYLSSAPDTAIITIAANNPGCNTINEVELQCGLLGNDEIKDPSSLTFYPNPNNGTINISNNFESDTKVNIYNSAGQLMMHSNVPFGQSRIEFDGAAGLYLLEAISGSTRHTSKLLLR